MTYTIMVQNHALQSGKWQGDFETLEQARAMVKVLAERSMEFMEYTICEGPKRNPGQAINGEPSVKGLGRKGV
jgi:hypothetical protein